jgi:hypothetical protein
MSFDIGVVLMVNFLFPGARDRAGKKSSDSERRGEFLTAATALHVNELESAEHRGSVLSYRFL